MSYFIAFLEGIITFVSPCLLPLLPVYLSYFAGGEGRGTNKTVANALGFVLGFGIFFVILGAFAGFLGSFLRQHQLVFNLVTGGVVLLFGLNYLSVLPLPFLNRSHSGNPRVVTGFFSALLFGVVFSLSWTPCVGAFLGSALLLASQGGSVFRGIGMLLCYSLGLGLPFVLCAALLDSLKTTLTFIKKHYKLVNTLSGLFLVAMGILMMTGLMGRFLGLLSSVGGPL